MKALRRTFRTALLLVIAGLAWQVPAQADALDDFIWILKQLDQVHANPFPLSGNGAQEAKGFIECLSTVDNDSDTAACLLQFKDTELASKIPGSNDLPSWLYDLLNLYIAVRAEDYWAAVKYVGEAGVCILAQYFTGGQVDVCSLVKELIELAKGVLEAGGALTKFIADMGEAAWEGIQDIGCELDLGGCDESTPAHEIVYTYVFAPKVKPDALDAIEDVKEKAYGDLRALLSSNAKQTPVKWSVPNAFPAHPGFAAGPVETAAKIFDKTVDAQWTSHLGEAVFPDLAIQRQQYAADKIGYEAWAAAHLFDQGKGEPGALVKASCTREFAITREFAHVDRWLAKNSANGIAKIVDGRNNADWCQWEFWQKHTAGFAGQFRKFAASNFGCADTGGSLVCGEISKFQKCSGLMASVYQQKLCSIDMAKVSPQIAAEVQAYFISKGSKIKCAIVPGAGANAAALRCTRPTQQYHCNRYYDEHYGKNSKTPLDKKGLDCALAMDGVYVAARDKLWQVSVPALEAGHPKFKQFPHGPGIDPLLVGVTSELYSEMQADAKKLGLETKTLMSFEPGIDGLSHSTFAGNIGAKISQSLDTVPTSVFAAPTRDGVNPPDPARGGANVAPVVSAAIVPARLNVLGAQARIQAKCVNSTPTLVVAVTVSNTGDALAAGRVHIVVREAAGRGGGRVPLPAIAKGGSELVLIPLNGIATTPGARQLMIRLESGRGGGADLSLPAVQNARVTVPQSPCAPSRSLRTPTRGG
jgi:hypothetical protein